MSGSDDYIPGEIVTLYIAALAAVTSSQVPKPDQHGYLEVIFWICLAATPVWVLFGVILQSTGKPSWKSFAWPMIAAPLAFAAYAYAIPNSWLVADAKSALFATLLLLITPLVLHSITLVYTKLLPP